MKNALKGAVALIALLVVVGGASAAKPPKTMTCPSCKMPMAMKKSKAAPVAIKTKSGTYYCCAGCASGKAASKKN
jgi:hypothetical protein